MRGDVNRRLDEQNGLSKGWKALRPLPDGPLDIIGDVHGELVALDSLLADLGYGKHGGHDQGRRLIFVGDLTDRGPESPRVVRRIAELVNRGRAMMVIGNHDLNAVTMRLKLENTWLFDHGPVGIFEKKVGSDRERQEILDFLRIQPLALQRDDLRVVHACWDRDALNSLVGESGPAEALLRHAAEIKSHFTGNEDRGTQNLALQNDNPVKRITSGPEARAPAPYYAGGKLRTESRLPWWNEYREAQLVVFGHYWRIPIQSLQKNGDLFGGRPLNSALGTGRSVCIDYSVGGRTEERKIGRVLGPFTGRLAALRWPERVLAFDDGQRLPLLDPGDTTAEAAT